MDMWYLKSQGEDAGAGLQLERFFAFYLDLEQI